MHVKFSEMAISLSKLEKCCDSPSFLPECPYNGQHRTDCGLIVHHESNRELLLNIKLLLAGTILLASLAAVGCTTPTDAVDTVVTAEDAVAPTPAPMSVADGAPPMMAVPKVKGGPRMGHLAPEIEGVDLEGKKFKLSDYRGKVVMLNFYGDWCKKCVAMFPAERKFLEEMKKEGQPFDIVGVNFNDALEIAQNSAKENNVSWRSFFMGDDDSTIKAYGVSICPTMFIIDADGIIRLVCHRLPEKAIKELIAKSDF